MAFRSKLRQVRAVLTDWRYLPFYLQRRIRSPSIRSSISSGIAKLVRPQHSTVTDTKLAGALREDGFAPLGALISIGQAAEVRDWLAACAVTDPYRPDRRFLPLDGRRHCESHVAYHADSDVLACPHLLSIANHPDVLGVAAAFLGCKPTIGYIAAWWSYSTTVGPQQAENFHRDVDDWRFVKLFVYLTDVDDDNGPHIYVHGSAASEKLSAIRRYTDEEITAAFGADAIRPKIGKAGTGFLENTYGFHKGQPVKSGVRLMFQTVYSLLPLPYGPKTPPNSDSAITRAGKFDPWVNRIYIRA